MMASSPGAVGSWRVVSLLFFSCKQGSDPYIYSSSCYLFFPS